MPWRLRRRSAVTEARKKPNDLLALALADAEAAYVARTPESRAAFEAATGSLPGGNTRSVIHFAPYPLRLVRAEAAQVTDADGGSYSDFLGEYSAGLYGHSEPHIMAAIRDALDRGIVLGGPNVYEAELAGLFCARFPSVEYVRFCNSGTEGNLMALGAARGFTGRDKILVFEGAYHGGVLYFADYAARVTVPFDYIHGVYNDLETTLERMKGQEDTIAAILVEPMSGAGGALEADIAFLAGLRAFAERHGILLIFDEVMTSRIGPGGLQGETGITPDLTSFGKYLGGGLTFGAFGGRADVMAQFDPRRPDALPHAGTFNNNTLSLAAGIAGLRDVFTPEVAALHRDRGNAFRDRLNGIIKTKGLAAQVTGSGSIMNVHFQDGPIRCAADSHRTRPEARTLFHLEMLARGIYFARRGYMSLSLALTDADYDRYCSAFEEVLDAHGAVLSG